MASPVFYTVTNNRYYAGTVATLSSIRRFYRDEPIWVFPECRNSLTKAQSEHLRSLENVRLVPAAELTVGEVKEAWQMKAHSACFLAGMGAECIIQVDSDAVLCARLDGIVEQVTSQRLPAGGKDGNDKTYDLVKHAPYYDLCQTTAKDLRATTLPYISTSILFLPVPEIDEILQLWSKGVDEAEFGPKERKRRLYTGYSDQGIFNAILYFKGITPIVLDNNLVSQHWVHGRDKIESRNGEFWNNGKPQIAFHSVGHAPKFWMPQYVDFMAKSGNLEAVYQYWLSNLFDGPCGLLRTAPLALLEQRQGEYFPGGPAAHLFREYRVRNGFASDMISDHAPQAGLHHGNGNTSAATVAASFAPAPASPAPAPLQRSP